MKRNPIDCLAWLALAALIAGLTVAVWSLMVGVDL